VDKLESVIAEKREQIADLEASIAAFQRQKEVAEAELRALELASEMRPKPGVRLTIGKKGRQPGAISHKWRDTLRDAYGRTPLSYSELVEIARRNGIDADISGVRDRVRFFIESGFMDGTAEDGFAVTTDAAERFGFKHDDVNEFGDLL